MRSPTCFQGSDVSCLLVTPEAHQFACVGDSDSAVVSVRLSTIMALTAASIAMPMKASV